MNQTYMNWSSGKDAALSLYHIQKQKKFHVSELVTTINQDYKRVSMHGLRIALLEQQARQLGISLRTIPFPAQVSMETYTKTMAIAVKALKESGYTHCVFGDIFLEDLRDYRENELKKVGIQPIFPLWKRDTKEVFQECIQLGFKAITVCVNAKYLDESFCGRILDQQFLNDLPENVDPCGEHGEFHTFVFDGPIFSNPIHFEIGEKVLRSYQPATDTKDDCFTDNQDHSWDTSFWYCDLVPKR
ncbi:diphthine--ammonia ligase [Aquimarina sp. U1-2]|uniref:Dph6-related ATP pyrophosphatase n=1 Tax=Aquimarina sp. U1-2 TaxID=2823141 RepID=UPI001AED09C0|nr:diphthine--ammonia ligase [Aquimarina sp. U1-2]MBP2833530.1 diphthine--ammonia ligase [Aquimarina sp. U1-2]